VAFVEALLLFPGINLNKGETAKGSTPLHGIYFLGNSKKIVACWSEKPDIAARLVWMGADHLCQNIYKLTPKDEARGDVISFGNFYLKPSGSIFFPYVCRGRISRNCKEIPTGLAT
jgi:hypothetical protein